ncbi:membrane permease [Rhizoctonia solani]|uniref:Membrane permease n=1 Tax=Rhizoctonia solani TaxID=456999 RepID=A0A8H8PA40_9AGAM|nr:membrane permease [Rhizoctonia solani]QRW27082.1 membrane permease [Rhizoctonia solani]
MAVRRASNMITPPGLTVPMNEEKNIQITEKANKSIVGLWRIGSRASWSDEPEEHPSSSNIKLRTEKGAIDAHVVVTSYARDDRPQVDVSTTTGPLTIRMTRTENSRFDLRAESHSGAITVYLPTDFHGVIMYRSRHLATFSRLAASLRGVTMTSAPIGCDGEVDCDNTMEVIYSDRAMCCDEIPKDCDGIKINSPRGRIHFLVAGEHPPAFGGMWDHLKTAIGCGLDAITDDLDSNIHYPLIQLFNTLFFLWFTAENLFVFTLSLGLRDPTDVDPIPYPRYGFGVGRRTLLTPAPWAFAILFLVHVLFAGSIAFVQWTERGKEIIIRGLTWRWSALMLTSIVWTAAWKEFRVVSGFNWREEVFVYIPFALYDGWTLFIFTISTFAAFAPNAIYSGLGTKIAAIWLLSLLVATAHGHAFFTPGGNIPGNVAVTWGIFAIFAEQIEPSVKWAALALGIISVFAIARSVYVIAEDIRAGIGGGAIRLPPDEERVPANGANGTNGHTGSA